MSTGPNYEAYHIDPGSPATPAPAGSDAPPSDPQGQPTPSAPPASDLSKPHQPGFESPYQAFGTEPTGPPPQQPYPPQAGYQPPVYRQAYAQPSVPYGVRPSHPKGMTVLVLGIISVVLAPICGPFAWSMGRNALREIDAAPMAYSNRGEVNAGMILGIVGTVILILTLVLLLFYVLMIVGIVASSY